MEGKSVQPDTDRDRRLKITSWLLLPTVILSELACLAIIAVLVLWT